MQRRTFLATALAAPFAACVETAVKTFATLDAANLGLVELLKNPHRTTGAWNLGQVLEHVTQSIEYSMSGYPRKRSALFRATAGTAAFTFFDLRGSMSHALNEPIPGAPALKDAEIGSAVARLRDALGRFAAQKRGLKAHFAYGELTHEQYTRAPLMHLANHWSEVVRA